MLVQMLYIGGVLIILAGFILLWTWLEEVGVVLIVIGSFIVAGGAAISFFTQAASDQQFNQQKELSALIEPVESTYGVDIDNSFDGEPYCEDFWFLQDGKAYRGRLFKNNSGTDRLINVDTGVEVPTLSERAQSK